MNRPVFYTAALIAAGVSAWVGWRMGQPASTPPPRAATAPGAASAAPAAAPYPAASLPDFDARQGRSLAGILRALDAAQRHPVSQATVDDNISGELFALIRSLTPEEIPAVLAHLTSLPPPAPDRLIATLLGHWARHDGAAAMQWATRLTPARMDNVRGQILAGWAHRDPLAAWAWYQKTWESAPEPRYRLEQDFPKLMHAWALHDAPAALQASLAAGKHGTFDKWSGFTSLVALPGRRDEIMGLIAAIPDEKERTAATRSALLQWSASAPAEAAAWLDASPHAADGDLAWSVAERFGRANPRANADWLVRRTPLEKRDEAYRLCLYQWTEHDPDDAAAWLETAGPTDMSAEIIASRYARTDLSKAMTWARRVSPEKRTEAIVNALAIAQGAGQKPDLATYATDTGLSAEDLAKNVQAAARQFQSRF